MPQTMHYYREEGEKIIRIPCITPEDIRVLGEEDIEKLLLILAIELLQKGWDHDVIQGYLNKNVRILLTVDAIERSATKEKIIEELNDEDMEVDIINKADFIFQQAEKFNQKAGRVLKALKEVNKDDLVYPQ